MTQVRYRIVNRAVHKAIALNPQKIKVIEKGKVLKDGAYVNSNSERTITGIVVPVKTNELKITSDVKATSFENKNYGLIADETADIKSDSNLRTTIICNEGKFEIDFVNAFFIEDKVAGYECGLERVD